MPSVAGKNASPQSSGSAESLLGASPHQPQSPVHCEAALAVGAEILHAPREWPEYHAGYYGVFLRDLDGHNVEAVHHTF